MRLKLSFVVVFYIGVLNSICGQVELKFDCYKLILEKCPANFLPMGGDFDADVVITARITNDCNPGNPALEGYFKFELRNVSTEPGYCLNAPKNLPLPPNEDSNTWKDLQFPTQTGFTISTDKMKATSSSDDDWNQITVLVRSYDYGAHGTINAVFIAANGDVLFGKEENGTQNFTSIPLDDDGNFIADNAPYNLNEGVPTDDEDNMPMGTGVHGDGVIRWEEYRGFQHLDGTHVRLNPQVKDVFINNLEVSDVEGIGLAADTYLGGLGVHEIGENPSLISTFTNFNYGLYNDTDTKVVRSLVITAEDMLPENPSDDYWGHTTSIGSPQTPYNYEECLVNVGLIKNGAKLSFDMNETAEWFSVTSDIYGLYQKYNGEGGWVKIDNEVIEYGTSLGTYFSGVTERNPGSFHTIGTQVDFFINPIEFIEVVMNHELGHGVNLKHCTFGQNSIMQEFMNGGATLNHSVGQRGYYNTFNDDDGCDQLFNTIQIK